MATPHLFDLDAYANRIGYACPLEPTLPVLKALAERHAKSVPFENLSILLGHPVDLSPESLERKLVQERRGGYCFEQNGLMLGILGQIGFDVTPLAGRVRLESPREVLPPRTHLFLNIHLDGEDWLFDVGVGGFALTSPIRRNAEGEQETLHETRRIVFEEGRYFHQAWTGEAWLDVYEFSGEAMPEIDREIGNWWTSTCPRSKFNQNLFAARAGENGERRGILNNRYLHRRGAEVLETVTIESADQLLEILGREFGLEFPTGTRFGEGEKPWPTV
jgi:N-hydroxyarylamine O-acetyltransferase